MTEEHMPDCAALRCENGKSSKNRSRAMDEQKVREALEAIATYCVNARIGNISKTDGGSALIELIQRTAEEGLTALDSGWVKCSDKGELGQLRQEVERSHEEIKQLEEALNLPGDLVAENLKLRQENENLKQQVILAGAAQNTAMNGAKAFSAEIVKLRQQIKNRDEVIEDSHRLTRELDIALSGEKGAAKQASLCDLIHPARKLRQEVERLKKALRKVTDHGVNDLD